MTMEMRLACTALAALVLLGCGSDDSGASGGGGSGGTAGVSGGGAGAGSGGTDGGTAGMAGGPDASTGVDASMPVEIGTFTGLTGRPRKLAAESNVACALDAAGAIQCQGESAARWQEEIPVGSFVTLDLGGDAGCALNAQGEATCFELTFSRLGPPPEGPFTALAVGDDVACGVRPSGYLQCWGQGFGFSGDVEAPTGVTFVDVDIDDDWGCGITTEGGLQCWGGGVAPLEGDFVQVVTHASGVCTLDRAGVIACHDGSQQRYVPMEGTFEALALGSDHVCGLRADGSVLCESQNSLGRLPPPVGPWQEVRSYFRFTCARAEDGRAECWGPGFGDGAADLQCEMSRSMLSGTLVGATFMADINSSSQTSLSNLTAGYRFGYSVLSDDMRGPGMFLFEGSTMLSSIVAERALDGAGVVDVDHAFLQLEATLEAPGPFYCTGTGSGSTIELNVDEVSVQLQNVHPQSCPGTPVDGELMVCPGGDPCIGVAGTLEGTSYEAGFSQTQWGGPGSAVTIYTNDHGLLRLSLAEDGGVHWGVAALGPETPFAGAIYCAGAGSSYETTEDGGLGAITLRGLSRLDACPTDTSTDALTGCVR